ncbi:hypothetical protein C8R43DRAFT_557147 [Mycena crocata]|nr:hypothetical protein C8R43DRAFT_557147 [Mycena crocata]
MDLNHGPPKAHSPRIPNDKALDTMPVPSQVPDILPDDPRFLMLLHHQQYSYACQSKDWRRGVLDGLDYWERAEQFIAKRMSGEIPRVYALFGGVQRLRLYTDILSSHLSFQRSTSSRSPEHPRSETPRSTHPLGEKRPLHGPFRNIAVDGLQDISSTREIEPLGPRHQRCGNVEPFLTS